jgi:hypothetical protein
MKENGQKVPGRMVAGIPLKLFALNVVTCI